MKKSLTLLFTCILMMADAWSHKVPKQASAFIISPQDGAQVSSPFKVQFGIQHFAIAPAGENIHKAGHYHLLIDLDTPLSMDEAIPYTKNHRHFDQGETQVILTLPAGQHTLQLVVGDEEHEPFERLVSPKITIEVIEK